jgi:hypothetical protein
LNSEAVASAARERQIGYDDLCAFLGETTLRSPCRSRLPRS